MSVSPLQGALVAVFAHPDDEGSAGPVLARYAREGVQVYVIVATDGAQGGANTSIPRGPELARVPNEEMQCAAKALGAQPPIHLGFPDGALGHYTADPARLVQLALRLHAELQRLRPDVLVTWGADGGPPHPDHKLVSDVVTQLVRAGAPGVPERLFYAYLPAEGMRVINPARGAPPFAVPLAKYFTVHVPFTPADFEAARRSMACHRTQSQRRDRAARHRGGPARVERPPSAHSAGAVDCRERFVRVPVAHHTGLSIGRFPVSYLLSPISYLPG